MAPKRDSRPAGPNEENDVVDESTPTQAVVLPGDQDMRPRWRQNGSMWEREDTAAAEEVPVPIEERMHAVVEDADQPMEGTGQPASDSTLLVGALPTPGPRALVVSNCTDDQVEEARVPISDAPDGIGDATEMTGITLREFWPGARESNEEFNAIENALTESLTRLAAIKPVEGKVEDSIIGKAAKITAEIRQLKPNWSDDMLRLATTACAVVRMRSADVGVPVLTRIMWLALGDVCLIASRGVLRYFDARMGTWRVYTGIFPEQVYDKLYDFMKKVEGCFR